MASLIERLTPGAQLLAKYYVHPVYLVGSAVKKGARARDIDIAIVLSDSDFSRRYGISAKRFVQESKSGHWSKAKHLWSDEMVRLAESWAQETGLNIDAKVIPRSDPQNRGRKILLAGGNVRQANPWYTGRLGGVRYRVETREGGEISKHAKLADAKWALKHWTKQTGRPALVIDVRTGKSVAMTTSTGKMLAGSRKGLSKARRRNVGGRTMRRSRNSAASRWGVYVKGQLAYISNSKIDANKAASKLRLSGRANITQKAVGPNPISGKVPVVGWRKEFKKAAYAAMKPPRGKRNPAARGISARAASGRIGRAISRATPTRGYMGRNSGIGTRSVASGGRLRNPQRYQLRYKTGKTIVKEPYSDLDMANADAKALAVRLNRKVWVIDLTNNKVMAQIPAGGLSFGKNPRRRNAASVLRRRTNSRLPHGTRGYYVEQQGRSLGTFSDLSEARTVAKESSFGSPVHILWDQPIAGGLTRVRFEKYVKGKRAGQSVKRFKTRNPVRTPRSPSAFANPRKGYVVQVGESVAWVGKLASDAQKAMRKLMDAGFKSVKGFQAKLLGTKLGWRKQYSRAAKRNPSFGRGKLGSGSRFRKCVSTMRKRPGVYDPEGLCAAIGRRKYGAKRMARMAKSGRARRSNPGSIADKYSGRVVTIFHYDTGERLGTRRAQVIGSKLAVSYNGKWYGVSSFGKKRGRLRAFVR